MNILFVCKFNRLRSAFAEAYFNDKRPSSNFQCRSAGIIRGSPITDDIREVAQVYGVAMKAAPEGLSTDVLDWQNRIIIVADDVPSSIFEDHRIDTDGIVIWNIPDSNDSLPEIAKQIDSFIATLK